MGRANTIPWHLPKDLKRFKRLTMGHPILMGRKTYESIGRSLPGRLNLVITRQKAYSAPNCQVVSSLEEAILLAQEVNPREIFIIGGGEIYSQALPQAQKIYLTRVYADLEGDTFFSDLDSSWVEVESEFHKAHGKHIYDFEFCVYQKKT